MGNNWVSKVDPDGAKADDWYFNSDTNELEWYAGSSADSASNLTWVGTDSASSEYLSSMSTLFGGSGEVPFSGGLYWQGVKDYGSARWEQIKKGQIMITPAASLSVVPGKGVLVNSEQVASNVQTLNWLYETDFGNAEYAYYGGQFTGGLAEAAVLRGVGKTVGGFRLLRDVGHKSLFTFGRPLTSRNISGFMIGKFRFQAHKHWLPLNGVAPGTKVPHINFSFGNSSNYHILLGGFKNNGSRFFKGGF